MSLESSYSSSLSSEDDVSGSTFLAGFLTLCPFGVDFFTSFNAAFCSFSIRFLSASSSFPPLVLLIFLVLQHFDVRIIQYAAGKLWQPLGACRSHLCLLFCLWYLEYFIKFFLLRLLLCHWHSLLAHSNFLLPTVMIMFLGFGILMTGVTFLVDIEGLGAASSFQTSGSASSLTMLLFAISGNASSHLYTSAGASLPFFITSGFIRYIPDSSNPFDCVFHLC